MMVVRILERSHSWEMRSFTVYYIYVLALVYILALSQACSKHFASTALLRPRYIPLSSAPVCRHHLWIWRPWPWEVQALSSHVELEPKHGGSSPRCPSETRADPTGRAWGSCLHRSHGQEMPGQSTFRVVPVTHV